MSIAMMRLIHQLRRTAREGRLLRAGLTNIGPVLRHIPHTRRSLDPGPPIMAGLVAG